MFTLVDGAGLLAAVALAAALLVLPGSLIGLSTDALGFRQFDAARRFMAAPLLAIAVLPGPLAFLSSTVGLTVATFALIGLAACGAAAIWSDRQGSSTSELRNSAVAVAAVTLVVMIFWIDVEVGGRLFQSLVTLDMIKHAAITREIVEAGATPPADPFFARTSTAVFYYFYFVPAAMIVKLSGGLIDARMAVGGLIVWTAVALFALLSHLYRASGLRRPNDVGRLMLVLLCVAGVQIITAVAAGSVQTNWSNTMITALPLALLWVPHHVAGLLASFVALLLVIDSEDRSPRGRALLIGLAGAALASAAGLSIWVTVGTVFVFGGYAIHALLRGRTRLFASMIAAGVFSLVIAAPFLRELVSGSGANRSVIGFGVRSFVYAEAIAAGLVKTGLPNLAGLLNLILAPLNYLHELGLLLVGGSVYWLHRATRDKPHNDVALLLVAAVLSAFVVGTFAQSTVANNDLGWRVMMLAQVPLLLWTAHVLAPLAVRAARPAATLVGTVGRAPRVFVILGALGLAGLAYDLVMLRVASTGAGVAPTAAAAALPPRRDVELELRHAYVWLNSNVPRSAVVQHNPAVVRALAYALYGRHRTGVADLHNAALLGADRKATEARLADIMPLFTRTLPATAVIERAKLHGIDLLVITAADPIWIARPAWLAATRPFFASSNVIILRVDAIAPEKTT